MPGKLNATKNRCSNHTAIATIIRKQRIEINISKTMLPGLMYPAVPS